MAGAARWLWVFPLLLALARPGQALCERQPPPGLAAERPRGTVVLIVDDIGNRRDQGMAIAELPGKLSMAVLPHRPHSAALARAGHRRGKEIMLHAPMTNTAGERPGRGALTPNQDRAEFDRVLAGDIASIPHVRGVNNHMGSELTALPLQMGWLMQTLLRRDLYFVDSRTSADTVAAVTASDYSVPNLSRAVFLDNEPGHAAIRGQLEKLLSLAEARGVAVGIGHPYPATVAVLAEALPRLACRGIELALVSEVLERWGSIAHGAKAGSEADFDTAPGHVRLGLGHSELPEVEDTGGQYRVGPALEDTLDQMVQIADAP